MPPRRRAAAKPPADPPLDGCAIALSGKFDDIDHNHSSLETVIRKHGGTVTRSVTKATTHVVCTEYDFNAGTTKIAAAKAKDLPCVNPSWIVDTDDKGTKLNADDYTWSTAPKTNGTKTAPKAATNGTKSRKRASKTDDEEEEEEEEEEEQPRAKRSRSATADSKTTKATKATAAKATAAKATKATKATKAKTTKASKAKAAVKEESEEEEEDEEDEDVNMDEKTKEDKVVAEGQFIKKKDVKIPLDEFCTLPTYEVYVDPDSGMIYDASLNQSNSSNNNNKFYRIQVSFSISVFPTSPNTVTDLEGSQGFNLQDLDSMGSCRRRWPESRLGKWRSRRCYQAV